MKNIIYFCCWIFLSLITTGDSVTAGQVYDFDSANHTFLKEHIDPTAAAYAFQTISNSPRAGCNGARFELRPGDKWPGDQGSSSQERAERSEDNFLLPENQNQYYGFSIKIPASELHDCRGNDCREWRNYLQFHAKPSDGEDWRHPLLTLSLDNDQLSFILAKPNGSKWYTKLTSFAFPTDEWIDFVVQIKWSRNLNGGTVNIWKNGKLIVNRPSEQIGYSDQNALGVYWKFGIYRRHVADTDIVFFDELRRGTSFNAVKPQDRECRKVVLLPGIYHLLLSDKQSASRVQEVTVGDYGAVYRSNWSTLKNGKQLARKNIPADQFQPVIGDNRRVSIRDQEYVKITDKTWRVDWRNPYDMGSYDNKYNNTLFHVCCRAVYFTGLCPH